MTNLADSPSVVDLLKSAGINLGYGNTKVQTDLGYFQYISDVSRAHTRKDRDRFGVEKEDTQLVTYNGVQYEVGDGACLLSAPRERKHIFPKWAGTEPYMVLRQSVLDRLAEQGSDWVVTLGVPINEMQDDNYTNKVRDLWQGEHQTARGPIRIYAAYVAAEPSGALFYYGTTISTIETLKTQNLTILDFGYFTTLGTTHRRLNADMDNTFQIDYGVSRVAEHVTAEIRKQYREQRDVVEVERALLGQLAISVDNQPIDLAPMRKKAELAVGGKIVNDIRTKMLAPSSRIYLVGGGTHLFGQAIHDAYPSVDYKVDICDRPQQANAIGLHRMTQYRVNVLTKNGKLMELLSQPLRKHAA